MSGLVGSAVSGSGAPYSPMMSSASHHRTRSEDTKYHHVPSTSSTDGVAPLHILKAALIAGATSGHPPLHPSIPPSAPRTGKMGEVSPLSPMALSALDSAARRVIEDLAAGLRFSMDSTTSCKSEELPRAVSGHFTSFPKGSITAAAATSNGSIIVTSRTSQTLDIEDLSERVDISIGYPSCRMKIPLHPHPKHLLVGYEKTIFAAYPDGTILGFNPKGAEIFRTKIKDLSSTICADRVLCVGSSPSAVEFFMFEPPFGWHYKRRIDLTSTLGSAPTSLAYRNGKLFCGSGKGNIVCIDFKNRTQTLLEHSSSTTVHEQEVTHLLHAEDLLVSLAGNQIHFWDYNTGCLKYQHTSDSTFSGITYSNGTFYLATYCNQIVTISKKDLDKSSARLKIIDLPNRDTHQTPPKEIPLSEEELRPKPYSRKLHHEYAASGKIFTVYRDPDTNNHMIQYMEPLELPSARLPIVVNPYANILALNATSFIDPTTKERVNKLVIVGNNAVGLLTIN